MANDAHAKKPIVIERRREKGRRKSPRLTKTYEVKIIPASVYFDKERLDSLDEKAEVFLTMLASFAQEESRSISTNIKWATRSRMKAGTRTLAGKCHRRYRCSGRTEDAG